MNEPQALEVESGDTVLLAGTMKGLWLFRSSEGSSWDLSGPHFPGYAIYGVTLDLRGTGPRILAGIGHNQFGSVIAHSDDNGASWVKPEEGNVKFPEQSDWALKRVWQIVGGPDDQPELVYAGVEPAALFASNDGGLTFELNKGLYDHPHRPQWEPGNGGLGLHSIQTDPRDRDRILVAISTGGVYRSDDGGVSWQARNKGIKAVFMPDQEPEFGQCVHKIALSPTQPDTIYLQNHWGLYRSDDGADNWVAIEEGVPSTFGFPVVAHPRDPDTAYVIPLESDQYRATPDAKCRVYRTTNRGESWEPLSKGLPQTDAHLTILRDGFCGDDGDPLGLYFGTRQGQIFSSANEGESWGMVIDNLPPVVNVKAYSV